MPIIKADHVPKARCAHCKKQRPGDWFGSQLKIRIYHSQSNNKVHEIRYRKYACCWKCREFNVLLRHAVDPEALVPEKYRTGQYRVSYQHQEVGEDDLLIG